MSLTKSFCVLLYMLMSKFSINFVLLVEIFVLLVEFFLAAYPPVKF